MISQAGSPPSALVLLLCNTNPYRNPTVLRVGALRAAGRDVPRARAVEAAGAVHHPELGPGPAHHDRPGLGVPAGRAHGAIPQRRHPRRPGALHRHGAPHYLLHIMPPQALPDLTRPWRASATGVVPGGLAHCIVMVCRTTFAVACRHKP